MHIIYFGRHNKRHTINVTKFTRYLAMFSFIVMFGSVFYLGYSVGINKNLDFSIQKSWVNSWTEELEQQQINLVNAKKDSQLHLDAFSEQIAKLQAHVSRLDALGIHLSKIAKIDSDLFNFSEGLSEQDAFTNEVETNNESSLDLYRHFDKLSDNISFLDNQLNLLQSMLKYQKLDSQTLVKGKPIKKGYISSYYGYRKHPIKKRSILHRGIDFVSKEGTPILSVASGVVTWAGPRGGYGNMVEINHGDGYSTRYAHNSKVMVGIGDLVGRGDEIAQMGSTGQSTGTHVHFEVWRDGKSLNPISYLSKK